jgi:peroxygenase
MKGQRLVWDIFGWGGFVFECEFAVFYLLNIASIHKVDLETPSGVTTYVLLWPEDGRMKKDDIRGVFDGSIFYEVAAKRERQKHKKN